MLLAMLDLCCSVGVSPVVVSGGHSSLHFLGSSLQLLGSGAQAQ